MPSKTPIAKAAAQTSAATLPAQIEIFRAGTHICDAGIVRHFSEADVVGMVQAYDPVIRQAPLTIGHPKDNLPAYGWVSSLAVNAAGRLTMDATQVQPQFAEMANSGAFKKRSSAFYAPGHPNNPTPKAWYLRHVAFLGAQPPAISGLADFSASSDEGCVNFSDSDLSSAEPAAGAITSMASLPPSTTTLSPTNQLTQEQLMDIDLKKQLEAAQLKQAATDAALAAATKEAEEGKAKLASFAEQAAKDRTAGFVSFAESVDAQVLLPKDRPMVVAALEALESAKPVSFAEGGATKTVSPSDWFKQLVQARDKAVSFGEHAPGTAGASALAGSAAGKTEVEIHSAAKAHMRANPTVNYSDALTAVTFTA